MFDKFLIKTNTSFNLFELFRICFYDAVVLYKCNVLMFVIGVSCVMY